jgi:glycosyltransferase involved in cell wall biosynthesis
MSTETAGDTRAAGDPVAADLGLSPVGYDYAVSVIIPTFNAGDELIEQLRSLASQDFTGTWEVVLADNGSTDSSVERAAEAGTGLTLRVLDASLRRGPSYARNAGADAARGEYLAFCDADDIADPRWLSRLYESRDCGEMVSGVYEVEHLNRPGVIAARAGVEYWSQLLAGPSDFLPFAPSGNFLMRRDLYLAMGGFDETVPGPGGEDVDFSWRLQLAGHRLVLATGAVIHYRFREGYRDIYRQVRGYKAAESELYERYRSVGMRRRSVWTMLNRLWWLFSRSPYLLLNEHRRLLWFAVAGEVAGYIRGSRMRRRASR